MKRRLSVVASEQELKGASPALFEQLARSCDLKSRDHVGVMAILVALTARCITTCLPPSAQLELLPGLHAVRLWLQGNVDLADAKKARAQCFQAVVAIEEMTLRAVEQAQTHLPSGPETPLDTHADHVVRRYARLSAHFATSAVCHTLDALESPETALEVLQDLEGARAYQASGLGSARHAAFRKAAMQQATWETSRPGQLGGSLDGTRAVAVQVFHEYLGGRWRKHADSERDRNASFILWALGGR